MLGQLFCVLIIFLIGYIHETGSSCATKSEGVHTFGLKCEYMCHCNNSVACNSSTGDCPNGCDTKWFGPGCQFRNVAENGVARHLDNIPEGSGAHRANDGSTESCSFTNVPTGNRSRSPWWRVQLPHNETIQSMEFVTKDEYLGYFKGFKVTVENVPASKDTDVAYYPPASQVQLCYQHSNFAPTNRKIYVTCHKPLEGNLVRLHLAKTNTQLVLCDVKINGGRNLAFRRNVTFSSALNEINYPSTNAVDGVFKDIWPFCFALDDNWIRTTHWLTIDLGHLSFITLSRITKFSRTDDRIRNYLLYVSNTTTEADAVNVYNDTGNKPPNLKVTLNVIGRYVTIKRLSAHRTLVCEMEIYGDCMAGKCGYDCSVECRCKTIEDKISGVCTSGCEGRWTGPGSQCVNECGTFQWGQNCTNPCGKCKNSQSCDVINGYCPFGCQDGYVDSPLCGTECPDGTYGGNCSLDCSGNCFDRDACRKSDGYCERGCSPGYTGDKCNRECTSGLYGINCTLRCSVNCDNVTLDCHHVNGTCLSGCVAGWKGQMCDKVCDKSTWGENCEKTCGFCLSGSCDRFNGRCVGECLPGYKTTNMCIEECTAGTFGAGCSGMCSTKCKVPGQCNNVNGHCESCVAGKQGAYCDKGLTQESKVFPMGGVVGGVVAVVVVIATVVLVFLFLRRRKAQLQSMSTSQIGFDTILNQEKIEYGGSIKRNNIYENSSEILAELGKLKASPNSSDVKNEVPALLDEETSDIYYNEGLLAKRRSEHSVFITDLKEYVRKRTANVEYLVQEFQKLPSRLQHPTSFAKKPGNAGKSRYKVMYAYDHSRVVLKTLPGQPDSDYINAAFIRGHFKDNAYIAAQGPIDFTLDDFWRMIWEKDVYTIVMVTRLVEETKMKCVQYWPEAEDSIKYGEINILTESVDIFAEFTIRHIKVSHKDNPDNVRNVTQFHYTAWPDKDVPRSTTSLLHFWYQVRKHDGQKNHPWLVHCSAGVGRTGTFIALDILYDQGKDKGFVDVFGCVRDLRDQRVSMVQTKEQYRYLHNMLVEVLVLPSKPVHIDEFPAVYSDLQEIDPKTGKTKLLLQYETLLDDIDGRSESEDTDEMYTSAKQTDNRNKNRYDNILAANEYRPYLFTKVKGCTNYINAVYIPSYCDTHGYIITQTPLANTAIDCCRLVCEHEVKVIVTFEEGSDEETGVYLPDSGSIKHGPFTITLVSEQDKGVYISKVHKLEFDSNEHMFTQFVCKQWPPGKITPHDPYKMLSFLQDLECIQRQTENKPVVAQCLNGAERSGLIVVLMNIMERVRFDGEVSIPQVIRQLHIRRQQIIPNFEQFEFCYCVLKAHADSSATYENV
ncbi:receptor-type tyrosine-protein phosphatase mu-like [Mercenaria mercenaria]|uniref:receptor-type tyrosine-protein phosphatase mu-like n=1 Tax=Mercenaria mercenaria TaxID=6596 RepID=UPI00234FAB2D|nr:receptor-type tyrosine-protein phosphatase mu-like [Mercenaria mercenaria]